MSLDTLDFYNDCLFDNDINSVLSDGVALVCQRERYLATEVQFLQPKFDAKGFLVSLLKKPRTDMPVQFDSAPDNLLGNIINLYDLNDLYDLYDLCDLGASVAKLG